MKLTLIDKKPEAGDTVSFIFKPGQKLNWQAGLPVTPSLAWRAGQYMFHTLPNSNPDERGITRYFTISSAPFEKHIAITTRISDPSSTFKKSLNKMRKGQTIEASGPDGDFVIANPNQNFIFIAGGIGITPFRSILLDLKYRKKPINVQLLYANRDKNIIFKDELESLIPKNPRLPKPGTGGQANFRIHYFISPIRIDEKVLRSLNSEIRSLNFFLSGPSLFVRSIRDLLKEIGISSENIKLDLFPGYS